MTDPKPKMLDKSHDPGIRWLAGYQVSGWPVEAIAEAVDKDVETVWKELKLVANFIELTMRPRQEDNPTWTPAKIRSKLRSLVE
jgi:hypothetical protein